MNRAQWVELDGYQAVRGKDCTIYLQRLGWTADRGRFHMQLFPDPDSKLERELRWSHDDSWPRSYFDEGRAKLEVEAWLIRHEQLTEQTLEEATAKVKLDLARKDAVLVAWEVMLGLPVANVDSSSRPVELPADKPRRAEPERITVELPVEWIARLRVLGDPAEVLVELADHAQQGVYRPSAWEREWLVEAFGPMFIDKLETDPESPYFQRPRKFR